jgi:hypothetical protein
LLKISDDAVGYAAIDIGAGLVHGSTLPVEKGEERRLPVAIGGSTLECRLAILFQLEQHRLHRACSCLALLSSALKQFTPRDQSAADFDVGWSCHDPFSLQA